MFGFFKKNKECNYTEKLLFLVDQTLNWYVKYHRKRIADQVDFHYSFYAKASTHDAIKQVIKENRVDSCFAACVSELQRQGKFKELIAYGLI